jgi:hypothetical protein
MTEIQSGVVELREIERLVIVHGILAEFRFVRRRASGGRISPRRKHRKRTTDEVADPPLGFSDNEILQAALQAVSPFRASHLPEGSTPEAGSEFSPGRRSELAVLSK